MLLELKFEISYYLKVFHDFLLELNQLHSLKWQTEENDQLFVYGLNIFHTIEYSQLETNIGMKEK